MRRSVIALLGLGGLVGGLFMIILAPIAATLVQLAISRTREYGADAAGARIAGDPIALASALRKLETGSAQLPMAVNPAAAHMYIINPLSGLRMDGLFSTHPKTENRVAALRAMAGGGRPSAGPASPLPTMLRKPCSARAPK